MLLISQLVKKMKPFFFSPDFFFSLKFINSNGFAKVLSDTFQMISYNLMQVNQLINAWNRCTSLVYLDLRALVCNSCNIADALS